MYQGNPDAGFPCAPAALPLRANHWVRKARITFGGALGRPKCLCRRAFRTGSGGAGSTEVDMRCAIRFGALDTEGVLGKKSEKSA